MTSVRSAKIKTRPSLVESFEKKAHSKGLDFTVINNVGSRMILTNRSILENQIGANILSNAIKFTPKGGRVRIIVSEIQNFIQIEVEDDGIGIPSEIMTNLFEWRSNTHRAGTDGEVGTGYGMPLVKKFSHFLNIEIDVKSTRESAGNSGTIFTIKIPNLKLGHQQKIQAA
jgi:signal transduction histidine kinase